MISHAAVASLATADERFVAAPFYHISVERIHRLWKTCNIGHTISRQGLILGFSFGDKLYHLLRLLSSKKKYRLRHSTYNLIFN